MTDYFKTFHQQNITYNQQTNTITNLSWPSSQSTIYGALSIPYNDSKSYTWKLKIDGIDEFGYGIKIGIDSSNQKWIDDDFSLKKENANYSYFSRDGSLYKSRNKSKYGSKYRKGDVIAMRLNMASKTLQFKRNKDKYSQIKIKKGNYSMAVYLGSAGDGISLLSFSSSNDNVEEKKEDIKDKELTNALKISMEQKKDLKKEDNKLKVKDSNDSKDDELAMTLKFSMIESESIKLKKENGVLMQENMKYKQGKIDAEKEILSLENENNKLKNEEIKLKKEIKTFEKSNESLNDIIKQNELLKNKAQQISIENNKYKQEILSVSESNKSLQNKCDSIQRDNDKLLDNAKKLKTTIKDLETQNNGLQQDNRRLTDELEKIRINESNLEDMMKENTNKDQEIEALKRDNNKLLDDAKESEMTIQDLKKEIKELKLANIDPSKYLEWESEEILEWIMSLENGRYLKYSAVLKESLINEQVKGIHLGKVDSLDVKGWGVAQFDDKKDLTQSIQQLVQQNIAKNAGLIEGASTAYIAH